MRNFKYNHKRNRFRSNGDRSAKNHHINKDNFQFTDSLDQKRRGFLKQNLNCLKLVDKYNDLAREALANGDKILSENYFQHADHFTRIIEEQDKRRLTQNVESSEADKIKENNLEEKLKGNICKYNE